MEFKSLKNIESSFRQIRLFVKSFQTATANGELTGLLDMAEVKEWIDENPSKEDNQAWQLLSDLPDESNPVAVIVE